MKKLLFAVSVFGLLGGCAVTDTTGKPVPIVIQASNPNAVLIDGRLKDHPLPIHVCKIKPFTKTYQSESTNRGKAKLDVLKQCAADVHEMFCQKDEIECTEYQ